MSQLIPPNIPELQGQPPQSDIHPHARQNHNQPPRPGMGPGPDPNLDPKLSGEQLQLAGLDHNQILNLLRHLPGIFNKQGGNMSTTEQIQQHLAASSARPMPGPSNFTFTTTPGPELPATSVPPPPPVRYNAWPTDNGADSAGGPQNGKPNKRKRGGKAPGSGDDVEGNDEAEDWTRQRKDNHKEVERRRRGNINEGINELARIVPNGGGEKAKGAILNRAVQYIHHLKENEARNIEKWTLEKLLMDQAMGDLQAQLEEMRRLLDEEHQAKERALIELDVIRAGGRGAGVHMHMASGTNSNTAANSNPNAFNTRDRAYHPSDRHHHVELQDEHEDAKIGEENLAPGDDGAGGGNGGLREPDVAEGRANSDHDAEGDGDEEGSGERVDGKRRRVE